MKGFMNSKRIKENVVKIIKKQKELQETSKGGLYKTNILILI